MRCLYFLLFPNGYCFRVVENARALLRSYPDHSAAFLGRALHAQRGGALKFPAAAASYVLSRGALETLMRAVGSKGCPESLSQEMRHDANAAEVMLATCLRSRGITMQDSAHGHEQRFPPHTPASAAMLRIDGPWRDDEHTKHEEPRLGGECCASDTVSFAGLGPKSLITLHKALYSKQDQRVHANTHYGADNEKD